MAHTGDVFEGKTLDAAVNRGLETLGLSRAEVMITILEEGSGGFLGLGARPYRVRVMRRPGGAPREDLDRDERRRRGSGRDRRERERGRGGRDGRPREERREPQREPQREERRGEGRRRDERRGSPLSAEGRDGRPREERREPQRDRDRDRDRGGRSREEQREPREERREPREAATRGPGRGDREDLPRREEPRPAPEPRREAGGNAQVDGEEGGEGRRRRRRGRRGGRRRHGAPGEEGATGLAAAAALPMTADEPRDQEDARLAPEEPADFAPGVDERAGAVAGPAADFAAGPSPVAAAPREPRPEADAAPGLSGEELAAQSVRMTQELLTAMGFEAKVGATVDGNHVDVTAEVAHDEELLTGRKGEVRQALQHILNRRLNRGETSRYHLQLEINDFWKRREEELRGLALSLAEEALASGGEAVTEYLNAQERRIVHVTLRDDTRVKTYALGTGMIKRVAIAPAGFAGGPRDEED
jgi:predicted RNA-binding protein Jag